MKYVELIVFDLDGTLVDSKDGIADSINWALKKVGVKEKPKAQIISYIGIGVDHLIRESLGQENQSLFEKTKAVFEEYRRNSSDNSRLYPGVEEVLEYFKDKKKVIATNGKREFALLALKRSGIYDYLIDVIGGDDVNCLKPSSCPLDIAMKRFNVDRDKTIMVGDMDLDMLSGKKAQIMTCAVTYGIGKKEDILKARPDFIIDNILDLKKIIN